MKDLHELSDAALVVAVERVVVDPVADREELALAVEEEAEVHRHRVRVGPLGQHFLLDTNLIDRIARVAGPLDGINVIEAAKAAAKKADTTIRAHPYESIGIAFGVGTNLTNDVGLKPLNIVMKLVRCNGQSVAKLSDSPGKTMSKDETFLAYLRQVFEHPAA